MEHSDKLFCVSVTDTISNRILYINFLGSDELRGPQPDLTEAQFLKATLQDGLQVEEYDVPFGHSPLFWAAESALIDYVILVEISKSFYKTRMESSAYIHEYAISTVMAKIMDVLNNPAQIQQHIGHRFNLNHADHTLLRTVKFMRPTMEPVNYEKQQPKEVPAQCDNIERGTPYSIMMAAPSGRQVECAVRVKKCPKSFEFNDDTCCIYDDQNQLLTRVSIPLTVDLRKSVKYKFKPSGAFLLTFSVKESLVP